MLSYVVLRRFEGVVARPAETDPDRRHRARRAAPHHHPLHHHHLHLQADESQVQM